MQKDQPEMATKRKAERTLPELKRLDPANPPKVLLLGNGINVCYNKNSWEQLTEALRQEFGTQDVDVTAVPFPLKAIALTRNQLAKGAKFIKEKIMDQGVS